MPLTDHEVSLASPPGPDGLRRTELSIPEMHCGGCMRKIENALGSLPGVKRARVNLSTKRACVFWDDESSIPAFGRALELAGFEGHLSGTAPNKKDQTLKAMIRALAVAGFAAGNIMMFSVAVWAGASAEARQLFHWISAAIALPALLYAGRIFYISAFRALKQNTTNMDVPITVGLALTFGMSLYDTIQGGEHAYFDAAVTLLFFLLIGRTLDHVMRERARTAVNGLEKLTPQGANIVMEAGAPVYIPVCEIEPGMKVQVAAGERIPVDGVVQSGVSEIDVSLVTGESLPSKITAGANVVAGALNLNRPIIIEATATSDSSFLAEMIRLMENAETGQQGYRRIADRMAQYYSPVVHIGAFLAFAVWMVLTQDMRHALTIAVSVLIITCPCALGLAVPMVQVVAAKRLFENGVIAKDGAALERLNDINTIVFDKTGTLTEGRPKLINREEIAREHLKLSSNIAAHSRHPYSRAIAIAQPPDGSHANTFDYITEHAGDGMEAAIGENIYRLGRAAWALKDGDAALGPSNAASVVLSCNGESLASFRFEDHLRPAARLTIERLQGAGYNVEILSGDRPQATAQVAADLGVTNYQGGVSPAEKLNRLKSLEKAGQHILMVGDGLNDAPAIAAAHVSMTPGAAADVGRNAADFIFLQNGLDSVLTTILIAKRAHGLVRQNFALALTYNAIAVPFAFLGFVTPLFAAIAMSLSSIIVVLNALRLSVSSPTHRRKFNACNSQRGQAITAAS